MKDSSFYEILQNNSAFFVDLVKSKDPSTNYDIQEFSRRVLKELTDSNNTFILPLKNYTYNKGLPLEILVNTAGIVLRDEVMKELSFDDKTLDIKK